MGHLAVDWVHEIKQIQNFILWHVKKNADLKLAIPTLKKWQILHKFPKVGPTLKTAAQLHQHSTGPIYFTARNPQECKIPCNLMLCTITLLVYFPNFATLFPLFWLPSARESWPANLSLVKQLHRRCWVWGSWRYVKVKTRGTWPFSTLSPFWQEGDKYKPWLCKTISV